MAAGRTVAWEFRRQLGALVAAIERTQAHYVRCVNPSAARQPGQVDPEYVRLQLRCGGVVEAARVARAGFPARCLFADLAARFRGLLSAAAAAALPPAAAVAAGGDAAAAAAVAVLAACGVAPGAYRLGRTKVFFRAGAMEQLEARLADRCAGAALRLQVVARRRAALGRVRRVREARAAAAAAAAAAAVSTLQAAARRSQAAASYSESISALKAAAAAAEAADAVVAAAKLPSKRGRAVLDEEEAVDSCLRDTGQEIFHDCGGGSGGSGSATRRRISGAVGGGDNPEAMGEREAPSPPFCGAAVAAAAAAAASGEVGRLRGVVRALESELERSRAGGVPG